MPTTVISYSVLIAPGRIGKWATAAAEWDANQSAGKPAVRDSFRYLDVRTRHAPPLRVTISFSQLAVILICKVQSQWRHPVDDLPEKPAKHDTKRQTRKIQIVIFQLWCLPARLPENLRRLRGRSAGQPRQRARTRRRAARSGTGQGSGIAQCERQEAQRAA